MLRDSIANAHETTTLNLIFGACVVRYYIPLFVFRIVCLLLCTFCLYFFYLLVCVSVFLLDQESVSLVVVFLMLQFFWSFICL
jgi:hypothetical protein